MVNILNRGAAISYIRVKANSLNVDPAAVLAIAEQEGLSGNIGDNGHAFGPFQLNDAGGVFPAAMQGMTAAQKQQWAWSPEGIDYALNLIAGVAGGLRGNQAIQSIVSNFERPSPDYGPTHRNLQIEEFTNAVANYTKWLTVNPGEVTDTSPPVVTVPSTTTALGDTVGVGAGAPPDNGIKLFSTPIGNISIPSGLIVALWGAVALLVGALLTFGEINKPKVTLNMPKAKVG